MKPSIGVVIAATALVVGGLSSAHAAAWQRSRTAQGYYAAYVDNGSGAIFRVDCGASDDGARTEIQSITYIPNRGVPSGRTAEGTIKIDGKSFPATFKTTQDGNNPVEIKLGVDDLDSLELLKDIVARMRNGRTLAIELSQLRVHDTFGLSTAAQALGRCQ